MTVCPVLIPSVVAVIAGFRALAETRSGERTGYGMAIAGIILGGIVVVLACVALLLWGAALDYSDRS